MQTVGKWLKTTRLHIFKQGTQAVNGQIFKVVVYN